ncbi:unnamed protein product [Rangifer tarandus platyrhynchus]|uniref:Uncharacterized protein n=1 Tax=Rangifer tarandus platyrhynchus TaxID=3082113 RepID=A0AC60A600_RANTA
MAHKKRRSTGKQDASWLLLLRNPARMKRSSTGFQLAGFETQLHWLPVNWQITMCDLSFTYKIVHHNLKQSQSLKEHQRSKSERLGRIQKICSPNCGFDLTYSLTSEALVFLKRLLS